MRAKGFSEAHLLATTLAHNQCRVNSLVPRLALFTRRAVPAGQELTLDYGAGTVAPAGEASTGAGGGAGAGTSRPRKRQRVAEDKSTSARIACKCGSSKCRGWLPYSSAVFQSAS